MVEAVREQLGQLIHVPNTWHTELQGLWAKALSERSFGGQAFFCNSGTEANEAAIKLARLHNAARRRYKIITFEGGFHGRTMGSISATAQPKYHEGLGPLMAGFVYAPFGDLEAVARLIDDETAAILIEPIQGEGGVRIPPDGFLAGLRQLADQHELLLMFDEVQTGCGRTGDWFAYQGLGVTPDVMTLSKDALRRAGRRGHADDARNRQEPAAGNARLHVRRQSDRRPRRIGLHRTDRARQSACSTPNGWARFSASGCGSFSRSAAWCATCASAA